MSVSRRSLLASTALAGAWLASRAQTPPASGQAPGAAASPAGALVALSDFEELAHERMAPMAWAYISGGAADEITLRWNREAYDRLRLRPRVLVDVSHVDTRVTLLGQELPHPILLAPTAFQKLANPEGELAVARAARLSETTFVLSTLSTVAVEDVAKAAARPIWFQLYVQQDRGFTRDMVKRAEAAGCKALVLTVDTPINGPRNRQERARFALAKLPELPHLKGMPAPQGATGGVREQDIFASLLPDRLTWKDVEWLMSLARVPVLLKGILNPEDADQAARLGVGGIIVSNHGARNLDTAPATIDALPAVADKVAGRIPVLVDGGIRRGTDIVKALALGAKAVLIGRPYVYGLAVGGDQGVRRVLHILRHELELAMALTGRPTIASLDRSVLWDAHP